MQHKDVKLKKKEKRRSSLKGVPDREKGIGLCQPYSFLGAGKNKKDKEDFEFLVVKNIIARCLLVFAKKASERQPQ